MAHPRPRPLAPLTLLGCMTFLTAASAQSRDLSTGGHPLQAPLKMASECQQHIRQNIAGYTCVLVKRERVDGELTPFHYIFTKIRHRQESPGTTATPASPFSVYLRFLAPASVKGREVLYVEGENDNELIARKGGKRFSYVTMSLDPLGDTAMQGNRYPITEIGFSRLTDRLVETAQRAVEEDGAAAECQVKFYKNARINERPCFGIHVEYPVRRSHYQFHQARVYVDNELRVPIRYEAYDWPEDGSSEPPLLEEYTYTQLKLNPAFSPIEFDRTNVAYHFR